MDREVPLAVYSADDLRLQALHDHDLSGWKKARATRVVEAKRSRALANAPVTWVESEPYEPPDLPVPTHGEASSSRVGGAIAFTGDRDSDDEVMELGF
jgi:hypothetical protein